MKCWFLLPLLSLTLLASARGDDLSQQAAQVKTQIKTLWLADWVKPPTDKSDSIGVSRTLRTLSHAYRLGYSTPQHNLLAATRTYYEWLRDRVGDKKFGGFLLTINQENPEYKTPGGQAEVISGLVEYARATGDDEPRELALKTWRFTHEVAHDAQYGGFYTVFHTGASPGASEGKDSRQHLELLDAATQLFDLTHDPLVKSDLEELLTLSEKRVFPLDKNDSFYGYYSNWKPIDIGGVPKPPYSQYAEAALDIALARRVLGLAPDWEGFRVRIAGLDTNNLEGNKVMTLVVLSYGVLNAPDGSQYVPQVATVLNNIETTSKGIVWATGGWEMLDFVEDFGKSGVEPSIVLTGSLSERAAQLKAQLQTKWLPELAAKPTENEDVIGAAHNLHTLSYAHRLGYSTPDLDLLAAARHHYIRLRDEFTTNTDGTFSQKTSTVRSRTGYQALVISALVEYAQASGEKEPRDLAIATWRFTREHGHDDIHGGYYELFSSLASAEANSANFKWGYTHMVLLEAGTALFTLTRDQSVKADVVELLDLSEHRFFTLPVDNREWLYTNDWKRFSPVANLSIGVYENFAPDAGLAILRAQQALGVPIRWVDFVERVLNIGTVPDGQGFSALVYLAQISSNPEGHADLLNAHLNWRLTYMPHAEIGMLDFVAAFGK